LPDQRRLRWLGVTSAAISASAVALLVAGAGPADAAAAKCPVGYDPASTLKSIQCNLDQAGKAFQQQVDKGGHPQQPQPQSPPPSLSAGRPAQQGAPAGTPSSAANTPLVPPGAVAPASTGLQPAGADETPQSAPLPVLTADQLPQVADGSATAPETHLISPAAATEDQSPVSAPLIAAVSGVAGAAVALNVSYAARRLRRRR
jgi:hypothetical protein